MKTFAGFAGDTARLERGMKTCEQALAVDPRKFRRIHRSTIVNIDSIHELRAGFHGDYDVLLRDGTELKLSHRYRDNLGKNFLGAL